MTDAALRDRSARDFLRAGFYAGEGGSIDLSQSAGFPAGTLARRMACVGVELAIRRAAISEEASAAAECDFIGCGCMVVEGADEDQE